MKLLAKRTADPPAGPRRSVGRVGVVGLAVAILAGLASACLMLFALMLSAHAPVLVVPVFVVGWVLSTALLVRGDATLGRILSRICLLAAVEWLAMGPITLLAAARMGPAPASAGGIHGWLFVERAASITSGVFFVFAFCSFAAYLALVLVRRISRRVTA